MTDDRWVVLGLAHPRASWFSELARWSTAATVPIDFIKCVSADETRARLAAGRVYSALLVGSDAMGLDRDLVDVAITAGAAVVLIDSSAGRDWTDLGVSGVLPATFDRADLMATLTEHAQPVDRVLATLPEARSGDPSPERTGRLMTVTGAGGSGTSTIAMALAQTVGSEPSNQATVVLADLARNGEQAMLHDAREVVPGVQELVDAHRLARLSNDETRAMTFDAVGRGYHLLLGLRRPRDWTAIRVRSFEAALDALLRSYRHVIADVDADIEGEAETGSIDVEDRNLISRSTLARSDVILVTGSAGVKGIHSLARTIRDLIGYGIPPERVVPVVTRAPRSPRRRLEITAGLDALIAAGGLAGLPSPVYVPERRDLEAALRDGVRLPRVLGTKVRARADEVLDHIGTRPEMGFPDPVAIVPGSLGSWSHEEAG